MSGEVDESSGKTTDFTADRIDSDISGRCSQNISFLENNVKTYDDLFPEKNVDI